jgi:hypothetical protein
MVSGEVRKRAKQITQLAKKQEELANTNGSYIYEALIPIDFHRIYFATIHVALVVQNSLLGNLTHILRHHKTSCLSELSLLTDGREFLLLHISEIQQWWDFYEKEYKVADEQRKEY